MATYIDFFKVAHEIEVSGCAMVNGLKIGNMVEVQIAEMKAAGNTDGLIYGTEVKMHSPIYKDEEGVDNIVDITLDATAPSLPLDTKVSDVLTELPAQWIAPLRRLATSKQANEIEAHTIAANVAVQAVFSGDFSAIKPVVHALSVIGYKKPAIALAWCFILNTDKYTTLSQNKKGRFNYGITKTYASCLDFVQKETAYLLRGIHALLCQGASISEDGTILKLDFNKDGEFIANTYNVSTFDPFKEAETDVDIMKKIEALSKKLQNDTIKRACKAFFEV